MHALRVHPPAEGKVTEASHCCCAPCAPWYITLDAGLLEYLLPQGAEYSATLGIRPAPAREQIVDGHVLAGKQRELTSLIAFLEER